MRTQLILLAAMLFLGAGCSGSKPKFYWYHPDRTFDEIKADYAECEAHAEDEAWKAVDREYFDRMRSPTALIDEEAAKKAKKSKDPAAAAKEEWRQAYRQNAFNGCMEGHGYVRLRPYQVSDNLKKKELPLGAIAGRQPD